MDEHGLVQDFYFPRMSGENHAGRGLAHRIGVWVEGAFSWLGDGLWQKSLHYKPDVSAWSNVIEHKPLGIRLTFFDTVPDDKNVFIRQVDVEDTKNGNRHIKIFFGQEFRISGNDHEDTVHYNQNIHAVIHHKGKHALLIGGAIRGRPFDEYSIDLLGKGENGGAWKDAENGTLSKNPIEHGSAGSVIGFSMKGAPSAPVRLAYWICAGETFREAAALQKYIATKGASYFL